MENGRDLEKENQKKSPTVWFLVPIPEFVFPPQFEILVTALVIGSIFNAPLGPVMFVPGKRLAFHGRSLGSLPEQRLVIERSVTSHYHGSTISGSEQSFLTEVAICIVKQWKKSMGYRFVLSAIMHCKVIHANFLPYLQATVCWDLKCCYHGNMRYYLLHSIEPTLVMLLCENLVTVWKRQIAISHWVLQKHSSEDTRQIGDRNAVYFIVYFQRFHIIILIII